MGDFNEDKLLLLVKSEKDFEGFQNDNSLVHLRYWPLGQDGWNMVDE